MTILELKLGAAKAEATARKLSAAITVAAKRGGDGGPAALKAAGLALDCAELEVEVRSRGMRPIEAAQVRFNAWTEAVAGLMDLAYLGIPADRRHALGYGSAER